ncbi:hypothetical protein RchiOBHm_Chr2g0174771 [Rosa chinensis]|uniref:Uncharacterized protein n=1 Tax=Rosa chinensis TaxID=74649 RepID=A0A2P6S689_ROSCH|nr:hypothetical protein RchiOBHm_Chr2g0174771 [Rosa chinensis]
MGVMYRLNLPYTEVYSNGIKSVVGHLKGGKSGDDPEVKLPAAGVEKGSKSTTKGKVRASEDGGEGRRKVRLFKPKVAKDRIPPPVVKSAFGVKVILPSSLACEKGKKREAASTLRPSGVIKRKVADDASPVVLRRSSRVANMNFCKRKPSSKGDVYVNLSDGPSVDGDSSPLSDEENESDTYEGKTCDGGSQVESFEDEDGQGNPTVASIGEDSCGDNQGAHVGVLVGDYEHNVAGALMQESAVNVGPCVDNCNMQDIAISDLAKESTADDSLCEDDHNERGGLFLLTVGGTSFEPHLPETTLGDEGVTVAILVSIGVPLCVASACSLAL